MKWTVSVLFFLSLNIFAQKTVTNGPVPINASYTLSFVEELRFGSGEAEDHYLFANDNSTVTADSEGNMYVADVANVRVLVFDPTGKFLRVMAKKGEGPGEFRGIPSFQILDNGKAMGVDQVMMSIPRFYYFDENMKFVEQKLPMGGGPVAGNAYFNRDAGFFFGFSFKVDMENQKLELGWCLFRGDFTLAKRLSGYKMPLPNFAKMGDPAMWKEQMVHRFKYGSSGLGACAFDKQGRIYLGDALHYRITRWDPEFTREELIITRKCKPIHYSQEDTDALVENVVDQVLQSPLPQLAQIFTDSFVRQAVDEADLPPTKPRIQGLLVTEAGDILVLRDIRAANGEQMVDVFDPKGYYQGEVTLPNNAFFNPFQYMPRMSFRNGRAYTLEVDENGDVQVVRYRVERVKRS